MDEREIVNGYKNTRVHCKSHSPLVQFRKKLNTYLQTFLVFTYPLAEELDYFHFLNTQIVSQ